MLPKTVLFLHSPISVIWTFSPQISNVSVLLLLLISHKEIPPTHSKPSGESPPELPPPFSVADWLAAAVGAEVPLQGQGSSWLSLCLLMSFSLALIRHVRVNSVTTTPIKKIFWPDFLLSLSPDSVSLNSITLFKEVSILSFPFPTPCTSLLCLCNQILTRPYHPCPMTSIRLSDYLYLFTSHNQFSDQTITCAWLLSTFAFLDIRTPFSFIFFVLVALFNCTSSAKFLHFGISWWLPASSTEGTYNVITLLLTLWPSLFPPFLVCLLAS